MLAAREMCRYIYLRTGTLLPVMKSNSPPKDRDSIVVGRKGRAGWGRAGSELRAQEYMLRTTTEGSRKRVLVIGGDDTGTLYGAYRLAEHLGARFYLHGDVVPDARIRFELPEVNEVGKPLFQTRGVNPWGSHPFGFDQWSADDYKAIFAQLAKMRMNFLGIHCYPEGLPYAEPTVWLGLREDVDENGRVRASYPANYYNTLWQGIWGPILPKKTGDYSFGGALLFERDDWGPDVMLDQCPVPKTPEGCNEVFNRVGAQFRDAFQFARLLGVKTCLGTEAPLTLPKALQERLKALGKDPSSPATIRNIYEGIFRRIMAAHPLDFYWIWTPESWTWNGNSERDMGATVADIRLALEALENVHAPFRLATSGWVLGPQDDRAALDAALPKSVPVSALSRAIGKEPIDPAFGRVRGRERWAIPWLEGDGDQGLAAVQLWAGRTRQDAADALALGCSGLLGLHWRTDILAPNAAVLAAAAWDQEHWNPDVAKPAAGLDAEGPVGGRPSRVSAVSVAGAADPEPYLTMRYGLQGYLFKVPPGKYSITLSFAEPQFEAAGKRMFSVKLQGRIVLAHLDVFARAGRLTAFDSTHDIQAPDGRVRIDFVEGKSTPCISAIVIRGEGLLRKVNCGGPAYLDYAADEYDCWMRTLPIGDFYADWAKTCFGPEAAPEIARIFERVDSRVPFSVGSGCPSGQLSSDSRPWEAAARPFSFVEELAFLRRRVTGAGNLGRFDYWLNTFRYHRSLAHVRCALGRFEQAMKQVEAEPAPAKRKALAGEVALPAYQEVLQQIAETYNLLLATVNTNGGLATVVNLENHQRFWPEVVTKPAERLEKVLVCTLLPDAQPWKEYRGTPRIIVPTLRTNLEAGRPLTLKPILLDNAPPREAALYWRRMGHGRYSQVPLRHVARCVYTVEIPAQDTAVVAIEYYLRVTTAAGSELVFPAMAPEINQTVVIVPT